MNLQLKEKDSREMSTVRPVRLNAAGDLVISENGKDVIVDAKSCFPWSSPTSHIALVDSEGRALRLLEGIEAVPVETQGAVLSALARSGFVFEITQVFEIHEEFELRHWHVETCQGLRSFQTAAENWPRRLFDGTHLIEDVCGDVYLLRPQTAESGPARVELEALIG